MFTLPGIFFGLKSYEATKGKNSFVITLASKNVFTTNFTNWHEFFLPLIKMIHTDYGSTRKPVE
ncbi:hypothetical protein AB674_10570 [Flavobacterium sp. ABG]|nr:hypothetical protein AB674_10570 [Flavobacterium sp. ABG]